MMSDGDMPMPELTRPMIESEIERLISILDWLDPDPDFEDGGEDDEDGGDAEPLYGWTGMAGDYGRYRPYGVETDALKLDSADDEPELGSLGHMHQGSWAKGRDGEPSLGSLDFPFSQMNWADGRTDDREDDCEDEAAQCDDEGAEPSEPWAPKTGLIPMCCGPTISKSNAERRRAHD